MKRARFPLSIVSLAFAQLSFAQTPSPKPAAPAAKPATPAVVAKPAAPGRTIAPTTPAGSPRPRLPMPGDSAAAKPLFPTAANVSVNSAATPGSVPGAPEENKIVSFDSLRYWTDSRWYVIGRWNDDGTISWLGGKSSSFSFPKAECVGGPELTPTLVRPSDAALRSLPQEGKKPLIREILQQRKWLAIELNTDLASETFEIRSPRYRDNPECVATLTLNYGWKGQSTDVKPILFLKPTDYFFGKQVTIYAPDKPERANIQLDLYLGFWMGSFPNAAVRSKVAASDARDGIDRTAPKKSLKFVPTAVSRGEWLLPWYKRMGLTLGLEQTLMSFGGAPSQSVLLSDWYVGAFYQHIFSVMDALQFRGYMKYAEHLADQGSTYDTFADVNRQAKNVIFGTTLNAYFNRRWMLGTDLEYGLPNGMAGRGVKQSYLSLTGRLGFRLTNFLFVITELGMRQYNATGVSSERLIQSNWGIRLEL